MASIAHGAVPVDGFMPHGHCYLWNPGLVGLHVTSDLLIGLSYVAISATLAWLVYRARRNIPFHWMILAFGLFIVACGGTHFMEVWTLWVPSYWVAGDLKALTALASVATAFALPPLVPRALELIDASRIADERKRQLEAANVELAAASERLRELDVLKTQFFANVSHELRTPLALVLGPVEKLAGADNLTPEQRHDVDVVGRNARTLLKHVNDLLDVAKLEAGKMTPAYAAVDVARLVRITAAHFEALASEKRIALTVAAPADLPAELDPAKTERVVLNLLSNAFKFTPAGGAVRCTVAADDGTATIVVEDSGPGVRPELRQAIFERFRQGDGDATRRFEGTGLGLSIVKEFVELQRGTIVVEDAPGGGARFVVRLPLAAPPGTVVAQTGDAPSASDTPIIRQALDDLRGRIAAIASNGDRERPLVLVVEDNADMRAFIARELAPEYRVATAADGEEGLAQILELRPDLLLTDVMMPRLSGDELVRRLRAHPQLDATPIVLLTAKADDELRARLLRDGAQDYVMKPFSAEELRARVANLVTMKRVRDVLQEEVTHQLRDLETLARDVTSHKRELETAAEALRLARAQAEQASRAKTDFLSMVSHELRTPLAAIHGYLEVLRRDRTETLSPRQQRVVERMAGSSSRLLSLVDSLLDYIRVDSGRVPARHEPIDVGTLLREVVEEIQPQAERKGLAVKLVVPAALPTLVSDPRLVRLILVNLAGNAIKYTDAGAVTLEVTHDGVSHIFLVRDTGRGIPAEHQREIFEPFTQLESIRRKHAPGIGLGLALVKRTVDALGGRIELTSALDEGSTFSVRLGPAAAGPEA